MHFPLQHRLGWLSLAGWSLVLIVPTAGFAQPGSAVIGEIVSNDVYVRSGDSLNHYPVCKLNAGDKVTLISERGEWYEIVPPAGTFSLVSGDYVDRADSKGVVNGNNVRVRAGSLLNDNKYTVQAMLNKGAEVKILGSNPDGFLRIEPPAGATLWIAKQFVSIAGAGAPTAATQPETSVPDSTAPTVSSPVVSNVAPPNGKVDVPTVASETAVKWSIKPSEAVATSIGTQTDNTPLPSDSPLAGVTASDYVRRLHALEMNLTVELTKPPFERNYEPLVTGYQGIANQSEDDVARRYAVGRLSQLTELRDMTERASKLRGLDDEAARQREQFLQQRVSIPVPPAPDPAALDVQGELRESALYPAGSLPRRFRLVDPNGDRVRTIAYIEVPAESGIRAEEYVGRYVGVRAAGQRAHEGGIDPVPVYTAREIVPVSQAAGISSAPITNLSSPPIAPISPISPVASPTMAAPSSYIEPVGAITPRTYEASGAMAPTTTPASPTSPAPTASPDSTSQVIMRDVK